MNKKTIKLLEENIERYFQDLRVGKSFLGHRKQNHKEKNWYAGFDQNVKLALWKTAEERKWRWNNRGCIKLEDSTVGPKFNKWFFKKEQKKYWKEALVEKMELNLNI